MRAGAGKSRHWFIELEMIDRPRAQVLLDQLRQKPKSQDINTSVNVHCIKLAQAQPIDKNRKLWKRKK